MTWFKVDDSFAFHPKVIALSADAGWLWVRAGAWSAQQLTDGAIPARILFALGASAEHAAELVESGLWEESDGGWVFHDWPDYQPSREKVEADRADARERQRKARQSAKDRAGSDRHTVSHAVTSGEVTAKSRRESHDPSSHDPDPTRPDPTEGLFETFWSAYPRKIAKGDARKAWKTAISRAKAEDIIEGARRYAQHPDVERDGGKFIAYPASWLRADRWEDPEPDAQVTSGAPAPFSMWDIRPGRSA